MLKQIVYFFRMVLRYAETAERQQAQIEALELQMALVRERLIGIVKDIEALKDSGHRDRENLILRLQNEMLRLNQRRGDRPDGD